jgi:ABC-type polysaccharide/polyol phosphate export permease
MENKQIVVYRPNQRHELGFFRTWVTMARNIARSRELIWQLFKRDFFAAYKKSFVGITWVFVSPVIGIVSWVFLQYTGLLQPGDVGVPYPAYVLIGSAVWGLFMGFFSAASETLSSGAGLQLQISYPHEALLFKQTAQYLANFVISFVMNIIMLFALGVVPSWKIVLFPLVSLPLFFLGAALGLITSMIAVVAMDVRGAIGIGMGMLIWITPVIYSDKINSALVQTLIRWNPLTYLVCSARDIILFGRMHNLPLFLVCSGFSFLCFMVSWRMFYVSEDKLIERMI